jgi:membrane protein
MNSKIVIRLLKETFAEWQKDKVPLLAASLAYYTVFSIAPLLLIAISIAGVFFGEDAVRGEIFGQIQGLVGKEGASTIQSMLQGTQKPNSGGTVTTVFGIVTLLIGASGVFGQLQEALNIIWEVKPKPGRNIIKFLQSRFLSSAMVLVIGFLLLVSSLLSTILVSITRFISHIIPGIEFLGQSLDFILSFVVVTLLFASIYKVLPDVKIPWRNLWIGSAVTALLFNIGKFLIGLYLGNSNIGSTYGAAGSIIIVLVWIFYSAQILLLGAEFTQVYSRYLGLPIRPSKYATSVDDNSGEEGDR